MSAYYIGIHVKTGDTARVNAAVSELFAGEGFRLLGDEPLAVVVEDEDRLPEGDNWYGVVVSGPAGRGWVSVYVDDWADSGLLARSLSGSLDVPALETWVADDVHWGYTYFENGMVLDRFADAPQEVAGSESEAALYAGNPEALTAILQVPPMQFGKILADAQTNTGQFAGGPLDLVASAVGLPFEPLFTGYDYFFDDDPDDYSRDLENWPQFRHLAFQMPPGRETLAE